MSYPPPMNRQQIGIPQLPPRIPPPQYAGFAQTVPPGTPMIPVHMGLLTPTPSVPIPTSVSITHKPMLIKKDPIMRASDDNGGPTTTVFVGNISEKASDMLVRQLLAKCGIVLSWKRVQGASGKLQAFGFCEYKEPESTLRALRLLHELMLGDKKLLVKVDAKTKSQLEEWKAKKRSANGGVGVGSKNGDDDGDDEEVLDEETLHRDQVVKGAIEILTREYASELNAPSQDPDSQPQRGLEKTRNETAKKTRRTFTSAGDWRGGSETRRAAYQERLKNWEIRERKKARDYSKETEREDERRREMMKEAKRLKEFLEDYDDDRDDPKYYRGSALQKRLRDREKETELDDRDRKREKEEHEEIRQRLLAEGHPDPEAELQRMEEEAERRRQPPLKLEPEEDIVHREKSHRDRDRDREKRSSGRREEEPIPRAPPQQQQPPPQQQQQPPPQQQQPQSDDDDDEEEEAAMEEDFPDAEDSQEAEEPPQIKPVMRPITTAPSVSSGSGDATPNSPGNESPCGIIIPGENSPEAQPPEELRPKIGVSLKLGATSSPSQPNVGKRKKLTTVESVFNRFDEEEADEQPRKRKLVPLDYGDDDKSLGLDGAEMPGPKGGVNTEEKRKHIKSLIEKIPTARPELFSYPLDWAMVDSSLMDRRIKPWINKKIIEYIGEEEATLVEFVCSKVMAHSTPQGILDDVAMVLDEEAEVFIVKMWRLLIYETEAKKIGLAK
ncbi:hypothetical protein KUCAC02_036968 [Chaenocephalus aceratus]|nr:hypothetical protein KUCAC02_036968 [Chaenocephalus aceratus]